ncbi:MAG: LacI family DNA-binding transcriptional regulator [Eubacteriales bacterium]|nr:LacI family DNA-binding transcriptional regulator [Eubacteriales bacterium]
MAATIRDITKMTGLSLATVSKYLNGGNVLPENRAAIEHAIEVLHYEVNEVARGLATNRTKTVGVLIQKLDNVFASTIIAKIEDILRASDYGTIVCDCRGDEKLEEESIRFLLGKRVDGIITIPTSRTSAYLQSAVQRGTPIVLIDRTFEDRKFDSVRVDNEAASYEAVKLLIEKGHKKIAIICGDEQYYTAGGRLQGYFRAMEEADLPVYSKYIRKGDLEVRHGYDSIRYLMEMEERPTAVFLSNYEITMGAVIALNEAEISFPEEISIIGFDNLLLSQVIRPKLWMVVQPMEEIARAAAELMLDRLTGTGKEAGKEAEEEADAPRLVMLKTSIYQGESIRELRGEE